MKSSGNSNPPRLCVYTAMIGRYEPLNEQPVARQSGLPFICLTDDPDLRSDTWQIRMVSPKFGMDPIRSQRDFKLRPHLHLNDFDASLYIDNSVILKQPPEKIFERHFPASGVALPEHSYRASVLDEFLQVATSGLDDQARVFEQLNHYMIDCADVLEERPYWAGILLRDHRSEQTRDAMEIWYAHVMRYSRRDQLSVNAMFRRSKLVPDVMKIDNFSSWFHSWPHTEGRKRDSGRHTPMAALSPPVARVKQLERELVELERKHNEVVASRGWQTATAFHQYAQRHPRIARWAMRAFKLIS
ncbi:MAG: glycosyltransferase domain-containing protein [Alphaproteobacteria bacterium]